MAIGQYGPEYFQFSDGGPAASVRIFVFLPGTKTIAPLFTDADGLYTAPNPMWTDRRGEIVFFAEQGEYDLYYEYGDVTIPILVGEDPDPGPVRALGYKHIQNSSQELIQIVHELTFAPAGITSVDFNGDPVEFATVTHPAPGITELTYIGGFAGTIYLS